MYEEAFKNIDDVFWKDAGCSSALDYIEQTSWILFLKYLDDYEDEKETAAILNGETYKRIIDKETNKTSLFTYSLHFFDPLKWIPSVV